MGWCLARTFITTSCVHICMVGERVSVTRREALAGLGAGVVGASLGVQARKLPTKASVALNGWDFSVQNLIPETNVKYPDPDESINLTARIKNTGSRTGTVKATLGVTRPGVSNYYPASKTVYDLEPGETTAIVYEFDGLDMSLAEPVKCKFTVDLWTPNGNHQFDSFGWGASTTYNPNENIAPFLEAESRRHQRRYMGVLWGDWGNVNNIPASETFPYFVGWLGSSVVPVADVAVDVRDCTVRNDSWFANVLDCGGATLSVAGTSITVAGLAGMAFPEPTSTAGGTVVAALGTAIDVVEDLSDVARIVGAFLSDNLSKAASVLQYLRVKYVDETVREIIRRIEDSSVATRLNRLFGREFTLTTVKDTDGPVVLYKDNYDVPGAHIHPEKAKNLDIPQIKQTLRNADLHYDWSPPQNPNVQKRTFVFKTDTGKDHVVQLTKRPGESKWEVNSAWKYTEETWKQRRQRFTSSGSSGANSVIWQSPVSNVHSSST